ncbi:UDP-2,4-diacetamido-2,4,6-trideoxy-beta-L-altropyranose hydrolase [Paenibacillus vini]|uniref:UDP-2,4-diacetamido-2,4, 6-trideoxy-beta-L-altropyranose hydrolase n=1 Tax=Paenibacillus vini TaxID=1476024 RepID=UPI0025B67B2D|nr:UDP-2,4-diacetamido-2,4,6-trideoxy-beta-L-altropyranose hydrolase [Paenibacillus vini]MDN4066463.1 UDP-2,4-diacetamido-2,4,6-trideoxy-beta-L-altropyranose hydrolase [Paenibacillus vini]
MDNYVLIRADASNKIGTGHIMRCLALADDLKHFQIDSVFICRTLRGDMSDYIKQRGYRVYLRDSQVDLYEAEVESDALFTVKIIKELGSMPKWIIVDHYSLDEIWESQVRPYTQKLLVIDDLANRKHQANILLDQNLAENAALRYKELVPEQCGLLLGPSYLLLRPAFRLERNRLRKRTGTLRRLLVFFGGSDPTNETEKAVDALMKLNLDNLETDVIVGASYEHKAIIQKKCDLLSHTNLHVQVENMANYIATADFALGAGGVAMWERCYLGLPSSVTIVAENQKNSVSLAERLGAVWNLGNHNEINSAHYADMINRAMNSPEELKEISTCSLELMNSDSKSNIGRVAEVLLGN